MKRSFTIHALVLLIMLFTNQDSSFAADKTLAPLNGHKLQQPQNNDDFSFAVFGDFRMSRRDRPYPPAFRQVLNEIAVISPSLVVSTGDAYYGYGGSFQQFKNEANTFHSIINSLDVPFYNVIGNHETGGSADREDFIRERYRDFYGSFDYGNSHFIILNTEERNREGSITGEQLKWLEKDLEKNRQTANIFVFLHRPLFPKLDPELITGKAFRDSKNRNYLHSLFMRYKVRAVFAGHEHVYDNSVRDSVRYIITGGGGAPMHQSPARGGFFHYIIVTVKGTEVSADEIEPYNLLIRPLSGNDGYEQKTEVELMNTSVTEFSLKNLTITMPCAASTDKYKVAATVISPRGLAETHPAKANRMKDNMDGTATISIETNLPPNSLIRIVVESDI
jgi:hypothetical protein